MRRNACWEDSLRGQTTDELLASLKKILVEALEFNRAEVRQAAEEKYSEELVTL
jgi:hypothetical protein